MGRVEVVHKRARVRARVGAAVDAGQGGVAVGFVEPLPEEVGGLGLVVLFDLFASASAQGVVVVVGCVVQARAVPGFGADQAVFAVVVEALVGVRAAAFFAEVAPGVVAEALVAPGAQAVVGAWVDLPGGRRVVLFEQVRRQGFQAAPGFVVGAPDECAVPASVISYGVADLIVASVQPWRAFGQGWVAVDAGQGGVAVGFVEVQAGRWRAVVLAAGAALSREVGVWVWPSCLTGLRVGCVARRRSGSGLRCRACRCQFRLPDQAFIAVVVGAL
ncbi:hypothetical protein FQR65_LT20246 [Abscondita terminalis]|nr:hypothetical protein FQR65_LT20246 [Abscondita terminalis]